MHPRYDRDPTKIRRSAHEQSARLHACRINITSTAHRDSLEIASRWRSDRIEMWRLSGRVP
eukprot:1547598-Pleurochrysis_carterae.AAC.1